MRLVLGPGTSGLSLAEVGPGRESPVGLTAVVVPGRWEEGGRPGLTVATHAAPSSCKDRCSGGSVGNPSADGTTPWGGECPDPYPG